MVPDACGVLLPGDCPANPLQQQEVCLGEEASMSVSLSVFDRAPFKTAAYESFSESFSSAFRPRQLPLPHYAAHSMLAALSRWTLAIELRSLARFACVTAVRAAFNHAHRRQ